MRSEVLNFSAYLHAVTEVIDEKRTHGSAMSTPTTPLPIGGSGIVAAAVLSGNRNFEGRIHPDVELAYLASPPLVVAYAIAGTTVDDITAVVVGMLTAVGVVGWDIAVS